MSKIPYTLYYLERDSPQWVNGVCQSLGKEKSFKKHGAYIGYVNLSKTLNELKLAANNKLWYIVIPGV